METINSDDQQATPYEIGWLIGLIEGEGSVGMYWNSARKQIAVRITITNTDTTLLEFAAQTIRKLGVNPFVYDHANKRQMPHWKQRYDIHVEGIKRNERFLSAIMRHWYPETIKRRKAAVCLGFCRERLSHPEFHGQGGRSKYTSTEFALFGRMKQLCGESSEAMSIPGILVPEDMVHA